MWRVLVTVLIGATLVTTSASAQRGENKRFGQNTIHVQVRTPAGNMASQGAMVVLESQDAGVVAQGQTDSQGKITFNPPDAAVFVVIVKHPGFEEARGVADLSGSPSAFVSLELKPVAGSAPAAAKRSEPTVSAAESAIPKKAIEEFREGERLLFKDQKVADSVGHLKKAISLHKSFTQAYVMLGFAYLAEGKPTEAEAVLEKALALEPKSAMAHIELGAAYNLQKRYPDAERALTAGLALDDNSAEGHYELAKTYWATGRWQASEPHVSKALSLHPQFGAAHVLMGNIKLKEGDVAAARQHFQEYLRIEPTGDMAQAARQVLARLDNGKP